MVHKLTVWEQAIPEKIFRARNLERRGNRSSRCLRWLLKQDDREVAKAMRRPYQALQSPPFVAGTHSYLPIYTVYCIQSFTILQSKSTAYRCRSVWLFTFHAWVPIITDTPSPTPTALLLHKLREGLISSFRYRYPCATLPMASD